MLRSLGKILRQDSQVRFAYLFGSRATGRHHVESDWDVAVYLDPAPKDGPHGARYSELYWKLSKALKTDKVDVLVLNQAPALLAHKVMREGKSIFCRDQRSLVRFMVRLMGDVDDVRYLQRPHFKGLRKKFAGGGRHG